MFFTLYSNQQIDRTVSPPVVIPAREYTLFPQLTTEYPQITKFHTQAERKFKAITNVAFTVDFLCAEMIWTLRRTTVPNINKVVPPNTGSGINENPILHRRKQAQQDKETCNEVSLRNGWLLQSIRIIPLFYKKVRNRVSRIRPAWIKNHRVKIQFQKHVWQRFLLLPAPQKSMNWL